MLTHKDIFFRLGERALIPSGEKHLKKTDLFFKMIDYGGVIAIIFFYLLILAVGVWAGRKTGDTVGEQTQEVMLAGRNIGTMVGIFTMTGKFVFFEKYLCKSSRNFFSTFIESRFLRHPKT